MKILNVTEIPQCLQTRKHAISFVKSSVINDRETKMVNKWWRFFHVKLHFSARKRKVINPCGHYFALLLTYAEYGRPITVTCIDIANS